jgi:SAM-dependent methyltransferase
VLKTDLFEEAMGPDAFLHDLGLDGSKAIGMDLSPIIARRAASREEHGSVRAIAADVRRLPFADDALALIVSPSTLDHFADPSDLGCSLCELGRTLASDGRLVVTLDNRQNIFDPLLRLVVRLGLVPYYVGRSYRVDELVAELEAAGLTVQDTTAILHNPRLVATAAVGLARRLNWSPFTRLVQRLLVAAQELEQTRWRYRSGSFVAALATKEKDPIIYEK